VSNPLLVTFKISFSHGKAALQTQGGFLEEEFMKKKLANNFISLIGLSLVYGMNVNVF